jgi:hypothetical protein
VKGNQKVLQQIEGYIFAGKFFQLRGNKIPIQTYEEFIEHGDNIITEMTNFDSTYEFKWQEIEDSFNTLNQIAD